MSNVSVQVDATSLLSAPYGGTDPMTQLRWRAGLFGGADAICSSLTGFSPLREWVFKPVAGDWTALNKGADAWRNSGKAAQELAGVIASLPAQVGDDWLGATRAAWETANATVVDELRALPAQAAQLAATCDAISQAAQAVGALIADILGEISYSITKALIEAAVPVAGWAAEVETAAELAEKITVFGTKISLAMTKYAALLERLAPVVERMLGSGQKLLQVAQRLEAFAPKAIELAQAAAKSANTIKVVADNVQRAFAVRKLADRVIKFTNDAGQIADTAYKAYDQASGSAQTAGGAEPDATDAATAVQEPVTEPVP